MKQTLHPEWKELVVQTKEAPYGAFYAHETLASMLRLDKEQPRYLAQIQKWKQALLEDYQRYAEVVPGKGYRIVEPKEHHRVMRGWVKKAGRRIRKAVKVGFSTPHELLTPDENQHLGNAMAKIGSLAVMYKETLKDTRPSLPPSKLPDRPKMLG